MAQDTKHPLDSLTHFGVKGMRWGHRKKEEEPLNSRVKKVDVPAKKQRRKLTDEEKAKIKKGLMIGAGVAVSALAIYGGYKLHKSGKLGDLISAGKKASETMFDEETGFATIKKKGKRDIFKVNPEFKDAFESGARMNCGNCTIAHELRSRGLDVKANLNYKGMYAEHLGVYFKGMHSDTIKEYVPDLDIPKVKDLTDMRAVIDRGLAVRSKLTTQMLKDYPDGARGNVIIPMTTSNHFISWKIQDGDVVFEDPQNPTIHILGLFSRIDTNTPAGLRYNGVRTTRFDDLKINNDTIRQVVSAVGLEKNTTAKSVFLSDLVPGDGFKLDMRDPEVIRRLGVYANEEVAN